MGLGVAKGEEGHLRRRGRHVCRRGRRRRACWCRRRRALACLGCVHGCSPCGLLSGDATDGCDGRTGREACAASSTGATPPAYIQTAPGSRSG